MAVTYTTTQNSQNFAQGTVTGTNDAIQLLRWITWAYCGIQLTGTWTGTITFEVTVDGVTWVTVSATPSNSATTATSSTANGVWSVQMVGYAGIRARFSTASSGTPVITLKGVQSQL